VVRRTRRAARDAELVRAGNRRREHRQRLRSGGARREDLEARMTTVAYFDCFSGIAGDMTIGALIDAGVPQDVIETPLQKLGIQNFELAVTKVEKLGISATQVRFRGENE